jgi:hypothetical protein
MCCLCEVPCVLTSERNLSDKELFSCSALVAKMALFGNFSLSPQFSYQFVRACVRVCVCGGGGGGGCGCVGVCVCVCVCVA